MQKTKISDLGYVKKLNACGVQVEDISILKELGNLEVCSLSVNDIEELEALSKNTKLRELYLRRNNISDIRQVLHLSRLAHLNVLCLADNSCTQQPDYRNFVIAALPRLSKLDEVEVGFDEREQAERSFPNLAYEAPPPPIVHASPDRKPLPRSNTEPVMSARPHKAPPPMHFPAAAAAPPKRDVFNGDDVPVGGVPKKMISRVNSDAAQARRHQPEVHEEHRVVGATTPPAAGPSEQGVILAIKTLLNELSPAGIMEIRRHLNTSM